MSQRLYEIRQTYARGGVPEQERYYVHGGDFSRELTLVDAWNPPPQVDLPAGIMNLAHRANLQAWIKAVEGERADYQGQVEKAIEDVWVERRARQANRALQTAKLQEEIAQIKDKIAQLGELDGQDAEACQEDVTSIKRIASEYYERIESQVEGANQLIEWIDARAENRTPRNKDNSSSSSSNNNSSSSSNRAPNELLCPITHELMVDPVVTVDGHTYERSAIERHFANTPANENPRSPVTGVVLASRTLISNIAIRSQCRDFDENTTC